jgi:hypothetical protein
MAGPIIGGTLAKIGQSSPVISGYPYALPNIISATFFIPGLLAVAQLVKDPSSSRRLTLDSADVEEFLEASVNARYEPLNQSDSQSETQSNNEETIPSNNTWTSALSNPFLWLNSLIGLHVVAFDQLLPVFLERPLSQPLSWMHFSSGLGKGM